MTLLKNRVNKKSKNELTIRERQVVSLLAEGLTSKEIGEKLKISPKTADCHRVNIYTKLQINNLAELVKYAIYFGLTSGEWPLTRSK